MKTARAPQEIADDLDLWIKDRNSHWAEDELLREAAEALRVHSDALEQAVGMEEANKVWAEKAEAACREVVAILEPIPWGQKAIDDALAAARKGIG